MAPDALVFFTVKMTARQRDAIREFCANEGVTVSAWSRDILLKAAGLKTLLKDGVRPRGNPALGKKTKGKK